MNKTTKTIIGVAIVLIAGALIWNGNTDKTDVDSNVIKIGVTAPLTGDLAFLGEGFKNSILLAEKDLKKNFPNAKNTYQIIFEDDSFDPVRGASAAQKLINIDRVDALISFGSPVGNAVAPIAESAKTPHMNAIASDPNVAVGDYNFIHWTPPVAESKLFVKELQKRGIKTVVLFEQNQPGVLAISKALKPDLAAAGITIVADKVFNGDEKDFRTLIAQTKQVKADLYILEALSPALEILAKQIRDAGIETQFTSIESFEYTENMSLFEGDWYVYAADAATSFVDEYKTAYGKNPVVGSPNGYDIVNLIVTAAEKGRSIKDSLYTIEDYVGAVGKVWIDREGMVVSEPVLRVIKDGKPVTI